ncbi:MAG TPA: N-acyl homoserine lactonase family protein [Steroidobacteraceae bacterium]
MRAIRAPGPCFWLGLLLAAAPIAGARTAGAAPAVKMWRLECGTFITKHLTDSCYLIRHGRDLMLWDAGLGAELLNHPRPYRAGSTSVVVLHETIVSQLAALGLRPRQVAILALSHVHTDHIGQAAAFGHARLIVGREDWRMLTAAKPPPMLEPTRLQPWIAGYAPKTLVDGDYDVFGDGSVVMLATPGHMPGHHSLLVRLQVFGPVLLSGDVYMSESQRQSQEPAPHDYDRAASLRSFHRFEAMAAALHAVVVIQHDPGDIGKLPRFPRAAD